MQFLPVLCAFLPGCLGTCCFSVWNFFTQGCSCSCSAAAVPLRLPPLGLACFHLSALSALLCFPVGNRGTSYTSLTLSTKSYASVTLASTVVPGWDSKASGLKERCDERAVCQQETDGGGHLSLGTFMSQVEMVLSSVSSSEHWPLCWRCQRLISHMFK